MRISLFLPVMLVSLTVMAAAGGGVKQPRFLECFRTMQAPVLDGRMDDPCWRDAAVATDFILHQSENKPPLNKTEVRTCYDAENLYFFWTMYEKNMSKLQYGPPEDIRDNLDWNGDVAELFLALGSDLEQYYQLAASPYGARFDAYAKDSFYNADWQVKTGIFADRWTIEMAIPFGALLGHAAFMGTPVPGETWRIQFCRDQGYLHEWSTWRNKEHVSYHYSEYFGTLQFAGSKNTEQIPAVKHDFTEIFFGAKQKFAFTVNLEQPELRALVQLMRDGEIVARQELPIAGKTFTSTLDILQGGKWDMTVEVYQGDQKVYHGFGSRELPPVIETFQSIVRETAADKLRDSHYPGKEAFIQELAALQQESAAAVKSLQNPDALTRAQWNDLVALYTQVQKSWTKVRFVDNLVKIYHGIKEEKPLFALGQANAHAKIYRDSPYQGAINAPLKLAAAGGETESIQLVVIPFGEPLQKVSVQFSALRNADGRQISADNFRWFAIDYVKINDKPPTGSNFYQPYEPDILLEGKAFDIERNTQRPVWLDITLPPGTPAGLYSGSVRVTANQYTVEVPLEITAFGFDIPRETTLKNDFWLSPTLSWEKYYGGFGEAGYSPELHRKHAEVLGRYRINPFVLHHAVYWHPANIKIFREKDGTFSFDFSKWEQFIDTGFEFGGNFFPASMGCSTDFFNRIVADHPVIDRSSGKTGRLRQYLPELAKHQELLQKGDYVGALENNRFYDDFMDAYLKLLKKKELLAISGWEYFDEPNTNVRWDAMLKTHAFLKEKFPEIQLFGYSIEPTVERGLKKSLGYIDIWAPSLYALHNENLRRTIQQRVSKFAERFIFYSCSTKQDSQGNYTPFIHYYQSYLAPRIQAWMAYKYGAEGFMVFMLNSIPQENMPEPGKSGGKWPETEWLAGRWQGTGTLIYPGPDMEAVPSIRMASFRDGFEDFEYFVLLRKLQAYLDETKHPALFQKIDRELVIEESIVKDVYEWTKDLDVINAKRQRLAELIVETQQIIDKERVR